LKHQLCAAISSSAGLTDKPSKSPLTSSTSKAKLQFRPDAAIPERWR